MAEKKLENYQDLCTQYYDSDKPYIDADEWEFYLSYAKQAQGLILEPMCGTGRLLIPLVKAGFAIDGFDASEHMLAALCTKAAQQNCAVTVWQGFVEDLAEIEKYDLIVIPLSSFNLISDRVAAKKSLQALYKSLKHGGRFVFELMMISAFDSIETQIQNVSEELLSDGKKIQLTTIHEPAVDGVSKTVCQYALVSGADVLQVETETYTLRFYCPDEMENLLVEIGFCNIKKFKMFDRTVTAQEHDHVMIFECSK